jgi:hypothetical protein
VSDKLTIWKYKNISVYYDEKYEGGGRYLALPFVNFIKNCLPNDCYVKAFEWCAGFGFIGFALLSEGICDNLCLGDINPLALECVNATISKNRLKDKVSYYLSDNLQAIPSKERFDLVVANPPNFYLQNPVRSSLYSCDSEWKLHCSFYSNIANYLQPGGFLCISEAEPYKKRVFIKGCNEPYDVRPVLPVDDFKTMIQEGGLTYIDTIHYTTLEEGFNMWMVVSKKVK